MEALTILEQKVAALIESKRSDVERVHALLEELSKVKNENIQLRESLDKLENTLLSRHESFEELTQERMLTKTVVDDLIKSIDMLIEAESHQ